jgi:hypothetical protein
MAKKRKWIIPVLVGGVVILIGLFVTVIVLNERSLVRPVSARLRDLDRLEARLETASEDTPPQTVTMAADGLESAEGIGAEEVVVDAPREALERCVSPAMLDARFKRKDPERLFKDTIKMHIRKTKEIMPGVLGQEPHNPSLNGERMMSLGRWDAARRYFWEAIEDKNTELFRRKYSCGQLAWLEEDPKRAARLLALSCEGDRTGYLLHEAVTLCRATGSDALAEHYLARLCADHPETARMYYGDDSKKLARGDELE